MLNPFTNIASVSMSVDDSTLINGISWSKTIGDSAKDPKGNLVLTFPRGEQYEYVEVPSSILLELINSKSKGKYFIENIKSNYISNKITKGVL